eukprot:scaffold563_cov410-Prasinococcus_capsulatus_cf.AAC.1
MATSLARPQLSLGRSVGAKHNKRAVLSKRVAVRATRGEKFVVSATDKKHPITSEGFWSPDSAHSAPLSSELMLNEDLVAPGPPEILAGGPPPPQVVERFGSVISMLFQQRIIRAGGAVDDDMANLIVAQLLYLDATDPNKDVIMYVNSPGGSVTAGMAIFDTMKHIRPDVSTICVGLAASMGAFLLSSGEKGKRFSLPNSRIMIHQPLGGAQGQAADIEIQANEILHHKHTLNSYLAAHTAQTYGKIEEDTDRDFFMSAYEAQEYGIIDAVIDSSNTMYGKLVR